VAHSTKKKQEETEIDEFMIQFLLFTLHYFREKFR